MQKELVTAAEYILHIEEKMHQANLTSLQILKTLRDRELEIDRLNLEIVTLKTYVLDLKEKCAVYIPLKGDKVDKKLAEYINNFPNRSKLKVMFLRESEGVYEYGKKKVGVKVEGGKIFVRVGGGFLSIDEFID